ncbi:hypothetical protein [Microbacterium trichothecenolyticum]|uniref:Peptidase S8/S53 domain-containing protein n=1 Tax=Microbacterium trichothecenolyticum TaxID=69370 RepID=A0ABU0TUG2_MICTR|nr:hypothetical protein [Microbacterium trichothecenolyticum]MDQ1122582.1 hypothetical protein [Microbacterium trichothecenolyticum]
MPHRIVLTRGGLLSAATALTLALTAATAPPSHPSPAPSASLSAFSTPTLAAPLRALSDSGIAASAPDAVLAEAGVPKGLQTVGDDVTVSVRFRSTAAQDAALDDAEALGTIIARTRSVPTIVLHAPPAHFDALASLAGVVSVVPASAPKTTTAVAAATPSTLPSPGTGTDTSCREIPVEADPVLRSDTARQAFGVDGRGVTVGIISDSFATAPDVASTPENDVRIGSLPGPGNPCGYTTPVTILADSAQPATDEGRAMAQNVHGIAPGAALLFHTVGPTPATFADAIRELRDRGADVIVDDMAFDTEPIYQRGVISTAVADVVADGAVYLSAIGNEGSIGEPGTISAGQQTGSWESAPHLPRDAVPRGRAEDAGSIGERRLHELRPRRKLQRDDGGALGDRRPVGTTADAVVGSRRRDPHDHLTRGAELRG